MKVMMVGGGSGGHLTPLIAVAQELRKQNPKLKIVYVGHRGDKLYPLVSQHNLVYKTHTIFAGKLRRYHGEGWKQLLDLPTIFKNIRDVFYLLIGLIQSWFIVRFDNPTVIFIKGGFVGVPVGLAARFWRTNYITHDSDAIPGLANRILAKGAFAHAVAMPAEAYSYPAHKTHNVGVPVAAEYKSQTSKDVQQAKNQLEIDKDGLVLLIAGGGLGAQRLNDAVLAMVPELLKKFKKLTVLHQAGAQNEQAIKQAYDHKITAGERSRVRTYGFTDKMHLLARAADVVISRAGATAMAEFAALGKAVIMVPNPMLTGGHQLKNAEVFADAKAAVRITEGQLGNLYNTAEDLLASSEKRQKLAKNLHRFARPDAAAKTAELILSIAKSSLSER